MPIAAAICSDTPEEDEYCSVLGEVFERGDEADVKGSECPQQAASVSSQQQHPNGMMNNAGCWSWQAN